jgi:hypothetical protein
MALLIWRLAAFSAGFGGTTAAAYQFVVRPIEDAHESHRRLLAAAEKNVRQQFNNTEARIAALEGHVADHS